MTAILVTGANGFLGRHLVTLLLGRGYSVIALDLAFTPGMPVAAEYVTGTVTNRALVEELVARSAGVIHAAAIAHLWAPHPGAHDAVNREGTVVMAEAALKAGVRLLLVSSYTALVTRETARGALLSEAARPAPEALLGPYPASKRAAEMAVEAAAERGLDAVTVLPSAPVGPGDRAPTPPGRMILDFARGATPALVDTRLDLVDVRALADGILRAFEQAPAGGRYLLSGEEMSLASLAGIVAEAAGVRAPRARVPFALAFATAHVEDLIARATGRAPTAPLTGVRLAARSIRLDNSAAREALGYAPPPVRGAVADAVAWFRAEGMLPAQPSQPA
ncbi:MAG: NAD-dependent epimerase/dehydratase family protein [Pseudomonadota bacterium]